MLCNKILVYNVYFCPQNAMLHILIVQTWCTERIVKRNIFYSWNIKQRWEGAYVRSLLFDPAFFWEMTQIIAAYSFTYLGGIIEKVTQWEQQMCEMWATPSVFMYAENSQTTQFLEYVFIFEILLLVEINRDTNKSWLDSSWAMVVVAIDLAITSPGKQKS